MPLKNEKTLADLLAKLRGDSPEEEGAPEFPRIARLDQYNRQDKRALAARENKKPKRRKIAPKAKLYPKRRRPKNDAA